jgi:hypothetical protein
LDKPNIVLIMTDDQLYNSVAKMPYVNGLLDWFRFDAAYLNVAPVLPEPGEHAQRAVLPPHRRRDQHRQGVP